MAWTTFVLIHFLVATLIVAQSFAPNPAWRNPNITLSPEERTKIAKDAIDTTLSLVRDGNGQVQFIDTNYAAAARLFSQMADFDRFTNQSIYKNTLLNLFPQAETFRPDFAHASVNWRLEYAIAAGHAYATYSDSRFLDWAKKAWNSGKAYTLSEDELHTGNIFGKNITMKATCGNLTMAGGTFWNNVTNQGYLNALSTGTYLAATSLLAEITKDELYFTSGYETEAFYFNHLRNAQGDMLDGIGGDNCSPTDGTFPANEGLMMEGLAVLGSTTQATNVSDHLLEVLSKTLLNTGWYNEEGILAADSQTQSTAEHVGQFVIRGLAAFYQRNETRSSLREYTRQFLGVQYNAVLSNARSTGSNDSFYSASWTGPPSPSNFDFDSQTNAMSILVAAIPVRDSDLGGSGGDPPQTTTVVAPNSHPPNIGAIIGGVIGGLAVLSLILVTALYLVRRRHKSIDSRARSQADSNTNDPENVQPVRQGPFVPVYEKSRPRELRNSLPTTTVSGTTGFSGDSEFTSSSEAEISRFSGMIPTEDLVRMLNERLQPIPEYQVADEAPPDYATQLSAGRP
ncbi:hypothetical protein L218DRAFT_982845 [Marasmius fiardii PR-910]|nr:hypothetical protein L218DRAFT_982845 [Marasmius fiardii PR-910]